jgi:hypothetical protein
MLITRQVKFALAITGALALLLIATPAHANVGYPMLIAV